MQHAIVTAWFEALGVGVLLVGVGLGIVSVALSAWKGHR